MSNLSIQTLLGTSTTDAAARPRTPGPSADMRDPAQAFNEVMQRTAPRESTPPARPPQERNTPQREPERARARPTDTPAAQREANAQPARHSSEAAQARRASGQQASSNTDPASAQRRTSTSAQDDAAQAPTTRGTDTDEAQTATGDLFADLALALSAAQVATTTDPLAPATASTPQALNEALKQAAPQGDSINASIPGTATGPGAGAGTSSHANLSSQAVLETTAATRHGAQASRLMDAIDGSPHKKVDAATAQDSLSLKEANTELDGALTAAMDKLAALVTNADGRHANAGRTDTPLSLSAALSGTSAHGINPTELNAAGLMSGPASTTFSIAHAQVKAEVGSYGFAQEFSQRVVMLAGQRVQSAQIALTPSDLGPISVSMEMRGQEASLVFGATHSATRAALEDALPRLREMFQAHGLDLVHAHVGTQLGQSNHRDGHTNPHGSDPRNGHSTMGALAPVNGTRSDTPASNLTDARVSSVISTRLIDVRV